MVHTARNEQHLRFQVHDHDWSPVDYEGISLMRRTAITAEDRTAIGSLPLVENNRQTDSTQ